MFQNQKLFLLLICLLMVATNAHALMLAPSDGLLNAKQAKPMSDMEILPDLKIHKKTNPEVIIFTQYKMAKATPNIDEFAKLSPRVIKAQEIDKSAVTIAEYNRMSNRYNLMDAKKPIIVHTNLELDEYSSLQDIMVFNELNNKTYFNYPVYGENIAIIPKNVSKFNQIKISKPSAERMFTALAGSRTIMAEFILTPEYADRKQPFTTNDIQHWLLLGKISELRFWTANDKKPKLLWSYRDPTYQPKYNQSLDTLFTKDAVGQ